MRTQITRKVARQACGTNSCSSPFIRVVITSFKRGGAVLLRGSIGTVSLDRGRRQLHERHPRHIQRRPRRPRVRGGDGWLTFWRGVGSSARVQTRDGTRSSFGVILTEFQFRRLLSWVVTRIVGSDILPCEGLVWLLPQNRNVVLSRFVAVAPLYIGST